MAKTNKPFDYAEAPGIARDILDVGLKPLACNCGNVCMAMAVDPDGEFMKLLCVGCKQFSVSFITQHRSRVLINENREAAENNLTDEEQAEVDRQCPPEDSDTSPKKGMLN